MHEISRKAKHIEMIITFVKIRGVFEDLTKNDILNLSKEELKKREIDNITQEVLGAYPNILTKLITDVIKERGLVESNFDRIHKKYCEKYVPELRTLRLLNSIGNDLGSRLAMSLIGFLASLVLSLAVPLNAKSNFVIVGFLITFILTQVVPYLISPRINRVLTKRPELYKLLN